MEACLVMNVFDDSIGISLLVSRTQCYKIQFIRYKKTQFDSEELTAESEIFPTFTLLCV